MQRGLFLDLRDRLLEPGGLILLSYFQFYCGPMTLRDDRRIPLYLGTHRRKREGLE